MCQAARRPYIVGRSGRLFDYSLTYTMPSDTTDKTTRPLTLPPAAVDVTALSDREVLQLAIAATPDPDKPGRSIPATRFAAEIAKCNERTLRRYLKEVDGRPLTPLLREKCETIVATAARKAARQAARPAASSNEQNSSEPSESTEPTATPDSIESATEPATESATAATE